MCNAHLDYTRSTECQFAKNLNNTGLKIFEERVSAAGGPTVVWPEQFEKVPLNLK